MGPRRIGRHIGEGGAGEERAREGGMPEALRAALASWPAGVTIVAVRAQGRVHALTVSAFLPVSLEPPTVLVGLGPNAAAAPYLDPGVELGISLLAADQKALATRFADTFPVGPSPFPSEGAPLVADALAGLVCTVDEVLVRGDHSLVLARVDEVRPGRDGPALAWRHRDYRTVE
ncbi:MAG TPA: flavin reductase family protein [Longimicrobiales bacterium]|nr:flavin reductase family protein [Longimicrobiales bacterium]